MLHVFSSLCARRRRESLNQRPLGDAIPANGNTGGVLNQAKQIKGEMQAKGLDEDRLQEREGEELSGIKGG